MWLLYLFLAVLAGIAWSAMRSSTKTKAKQAAIRQKLESSGFPMSASYVDVLGDGGIAQNTRGDRFLLARRDADNQIRTRSLRSEERRVGKEWRSRRWREHLKEKDER